MLSLSPFASTVLAVPLALVSLISQAQLWQLKEYRLDRLRAALAEPRVRARIYPYGAALITTTLLSPSAGLLILFAYHLWRITRYGVLRPQKTARAYLLLFVTLGLVVLAWLTLNTRGLSVATTWAAAILLIPPLTAIAVVPTATIANVLKRRRIKRAKVLRNSLEKLTVIGITGSYGKTSTKHFLAQLMPGAAATKEHRNDVFPVAQDMLEQLNPDSTNYIAEMGAYRKGEIAALAKLTKPRIGVITAIGNQHLATFGTEENILKAKWELIEALPKDGIAVLNADDEKLQRAARRRTTIWYSIKKPADIYVDDIVIAPRHITCRLHIGERNHHVTIPLASQGSLAAVIAAVAAAHAAGVKTETIINRLEQIKPYPRTMHVVSNETGATIIDDSYSANQQGVLNAIGHLRRFSATDKRIVLVPLIELGKTAAPVHQRIGQALAESNATVYIYGTAYNRELTSAAPSRMHTFHSAEQLAQQVCQNLTSATVILIEGRVPKIVRQKIFSVKPSVP